MATPKKSGSTGGLEKIRANRKPKKTSIGHSPNTRFNSKNDKRIKKKYRGQGK